MKNDMQLVKIEISITFYQNFRVVGNTAQARYIE